jgi:hypothetical protein
MEWEFIAPMIVMVVAILTIGGVAVLRPIAKRVSDLLELYARERQTGLENDVSQMRDLLETMSSRLQLMEERQDFTERLLTSGEAERAERRSGSEQAPKT